MEKNPNQHPNLEQTTNANEPIKDSRYRIGHAIGVVLITTVFPILLAYSAVSSAYDSYKRAIQEKPKKMGIINQATQKAVGDDNIMSLEEKIDFARRLGFKGEIQESGEVELIYKDPQRDWARFTDAKIQLVVKTGYSIEKVDVPEKAVRQYLKENQ